MSVKIEEKHDMPEARRRKSQKAIREKKKLLKKDAEDKQILVKDFGEFVETKSKEFGKDPNEIVNQLITSNFAVIEFNETSGKASLNIPSWTTPTSAVGEKQPTESQLIEEYRKLADNFAPVAAGIEWHRDFTSGGGFIVQIDDPKDKHKQQMKREIQELCAMVYQDDYTKGLDMILDILMYQGIIDGCSAAEIVYNVEVKFEDYVEDFETVEISDPTKSGETIKLQVMTPREPKWGEDIKGITRLKIIDDAVNRLRPYRHPKSGQVLFWTFDEKAPTPDPNVVFQKYGTKEVVNQNVVKFHPWEILWLPWNQHGTNLKGTSQVKAVYDVAKFVQKIQNAIGVGFSRWANKKYFFVCGTDKRPWGKPHSDQFLIAMEKMIKNNWVGIPVPAGFDIKEIGGEQSIFEGKSLLDYLTGMICFAPHTPIIANPTFEDIEKLNVGDKVLTDDGTFQPITKTMSRMFDGELIVLQPHYSPSMKVTPNHPIRIYDGGMEKWRKAEDVQKTDYVVFPRPKLEIPIQNPFGYPLNDDFLEFLGYYIGDGFTNISKGGWIYIALNDDEREKALRLTQIVLNNFSNPRTTIRKRKGYNMIYFGVKEEELAKKLHDVCGQNSRVKQIPESLIGMTEVQFSSLWKGLMASDGHTRPKGQEFFVSSSRKLIGQIYLLMAKFGVVPYIRRIEPQLTKFSEAKGGEEVWSKESWQIITYYPKSQEWTIVKPDKIYIPMLRIDREKYNGLVHNFAVANNETYTTFGCLVHNCAGMQYPREFLEVGRTQAGDKAWLAWTVRYGRSQLQIRRQIEHQLWERQLWCLHDKTRRISKKGVKIEDQEKIPTYVPKMEWRAEGQWHRDTKMKVLGSILNVANPADPPLKLAIEKEMATTMGLGEIDFAPTEELLDIGTKLSVANKKNELLTADATLEIMQEKSDKGTLKKEIEEKMKVKQEAAVNPPSQPDTQQKLTEQSQKRTEEGVSRTTRETGTEKKKGESKPMGATRTPQFGETVPQIVMSMPQELVDAMITTEKEKQNTEKESQNTEKIRQENERVKKEQKDLIEALRKRLNKEKTDK